MLILPLSQLFDAENFCKLKAQTPRSIELKLFATFSTRFMFHNHTNQLPLFLVNRTTTSEPPPRHTRRDRA